MARYFATNSLAGCFRSAVALVEDTTAGRFDSAYVANSIVIPGNLDYLTIPLGLDATSATTLWTRADLYVAGGNFNNNADYVRWFNGSTSVYRLNWTGGNTLQFQYWNSGTSAWVNWGASFSFTSGILRTLVVKIVCGTSFQIYLNGTLQTDNGGIAPSNAASQITSLRPGGGRTDALTTSYWSQIMGADYDIRDAHFMPAALNGNSATNTGGTGSYTDVNETVLDESTAEVISTVGNKMGQTHAALTIPAGYGIGATIINARGRVSGGTISDGKLGVKSGASSSSSTGRTFNGGYEPRAAMFTADPATSGAWTQTSFNNMESYFEAA